MTFEDFLKNFMRTYPTTERYLRVYGGAASIDKDNATDISDEGKLTIAFTRSLIFPNQLIRPFDEGYIE